MGMTTEEARAEIARTEREHQALEKWANERVKPWGRLRKDDYNFRSWAGLAGSDVTHVRLQAGTYYEYARESHKLRCLLALMNPERRRKSWEKMTPHNSWQPLKEMPPTWRHILSKKVVLSCSFEELDEKKAELVLGRYVLFALADLGDYLADNVSFDKLPKKKRDQFEKKAFGGLDDLKRVPSASRRSFLQTSATRLAWEAEAQDSTVLETFISERKRSLGLPTNQRVRVIRDDGAEVVALRIYWGSFTNEGIGKAMRSFAEANRPREDARCKEPKGPRGRGKRTTWRAALDNLSAMRLLRHFNIGDAFKRFTTIRINAAGSRAELRKVREQKLEAEADFLQCFPFGEPAANSGTWAERKSVRFPST